MVLHREQYKCTKLNVPSSSTFESLCLRLAADGQSIILLSIYRPGSERVVNEFFEELATVLEALVVHQCPVVIGGDINIHVDDTTNSHTKRLSDLLDTFGILQHVTGATHTQGHTLDIVITDADQNFEMVIVDPPGLISDLHL